MSIPDQRLAYLDCIDLFDKALDDLRGARMRLPDMDTAIFFRMRMHKARVINRRENKEIYERGNPMWGASEYDKLAVRIKNLVDGVWVYVEHIALKGEVQLLSEVADEAPEVDRRLLVAQVEQKLLTHQTIEEAEVTMVPMKRRL